jgi:glycosyltransferase involved in cell wall biosynthesis
VSIGLPVYNGARYLREALDSLLSQTFDDFELIICDNASTDDTGTIARDYAARDSRIRYYRNETNIGAPRNFNRAFALSERRYFKWASYDDALTPTFIQACVDVLDRDPGVVLVFTRGQIIDPDGNILKPLPDPLRRIGDMRVEQRFGDVLVLKVRVPDDAEREI